MLSARMPPTVVLATNKLQGSSGVLIATIYFIRKGVINLKEHRFLLLATFIGSVFGEWLLLQIDTRALRVILPILIMLMGLCLPFSKKAGDTDRKRKISLGIFAISVATPPLRS